MQVRMLDSGEADTWRYEAGTWVLNRNKIAEGSERKPHQQGVFRRIRELNNEHTTVLYVNTNKTADRYKSGPAKGYVLPWPSQGQTHQLIFYWLEKLRNWQEKYNPIARRTAWKELDGRHIQAKSDVQLAGYSDTCFLFRLPEARIGERHLPTPDSLLFRAWFALLAELELRLATRGETHADETPIRLVRSASPGRNYKSITTLFPLHSLRVSLITALALEGKVPFPILQKLVGHSRLLMTLYYTKPGAAHIREELQGAAERLNSNKERSIQQFMLNTEHAELLNQAICNNSASLAAAIPQHPASRNPTGWMPMHHGLCLAGGNTSEDEGLSSLGGCHNGGVNIGAHTNPKYSAVPGGARNCIRALL